MPDESGGLSQQSEFVCDICGIKTRRQKIKCANDNCNITVHNRCFENVCKLFFGININKANWRCKKCVDSENPESDVCIQSDDKSNAVSLHKEIDFLKRENSLINKMLVNLEYTNSLQKELLESTSKTVSSNSDKPEILDYSGAIKKVNIKEDQKNSAVLLIKAHGSNENVLSEIKNNVNPTDLNIFVSKTKPIKGGMLINCDDINSLNKLKNAVEEKFGDKFNISVAKKFSPRLLIKSVDKTVNNTDILNDILRNEVLQGIDMVDIRVVTNIEMKYGRNVVIEVSPTIRNLIMNKGYIFIAWQKCYVEDYLRVIRCYRCQRYGHLKKDCKSSSPICSECTGQHESKDCKPDIKKCINCFHYVSKLNNNNCNIHVDHSANDFKLCFVYKNQIQSLISKTNYEK